MKTMKKSVSLLLVFAMCLSLLLGIGPVKAYAAAEQSDAYRIYDESFRLHKQYPYPYMVQELSLNEHMLLFHQQPAYQYP